MPCTGDRIHWGGSCRARPPPPIPPAPPAAPGRDWPGDAVLAEPRAMIHLPAVLLNALQYVPQGWTVHAVHGLENAPLLRQAPELQPAIADRSLQFRLLSAVGVTEYRVGRAWYNAMVLSNAFWSAFTARSLLLFESDSAFCPRPTRPLLSFAGYAFVGAPWSAHRDMFFPAWCRNLDSCVGNSGFSLWRRDIMQNVTSRPPSDYAGMVARYVRKHRGSPSKQGKPGDREALNVLKNGSFDGVPPQYASHVDVWFTIVLQSLVHNGYLSVPAVPSSTVASRFSVETLYNESSPWVPVGMHKAHVYLPQAQLQSLLLRCPTMQVIIDARAASAFAKDKSSKSKATSRSRHG